MAESVRAELIAACGNPELKDGEQKIEVTQGKEKVGSITKSEIDNDDAFFRLLVCNMANEPDTLPEDKWDELSKGAQNYVQAVMAAACHYLEQDRKQKIKIPGWPKEAAKANGAATDKEPDEPAPQTGKVEETAEAVQETAPAKAEKESKVKKSKKAATPKAEKKAKVAKPKKIAKPKKAARTREKGVNLKPVGKIKPCVAGTKRAKVIDMLADKDGVTIGELHAAMASKAFKGLKPWSEATTRTALHRYTKGYGVRTEFMDAKALKASGHKADLKNGATEPVYFLVLPKDMKKPLPHLKSRGAEARA